MSPDAARVPRAGDSPSGGTGVSGAARTQVSCGRPARWEAGPELLSLPVLLSISLCLTLERNSVSHKGPIEATKPPEAQVRNF